MPVIGNIPIPILLVDGEPRERGRQHGELARDQVGLSVERYMARFAHFAGLTPTRAREIAAGYADAIRVYDPELLEEIEGVAEGAGFGREDLLAVNCRSEVMFGTPLPECTSFGLQPDATANRHTYVGQNWDWAPDVKETLIVLIITQEPKPPVVLLDEAGMIGRMGLNGAGVALATNTLISEQRAPGVPYNILLRGILNQTSLAAGIEALVQPKRAISANYLIGDGSGQTIDIEASPIHVDVISPRDGVITHGNHFEGARLQGRDLSLERFPDSAYRGCRLRDRLVASVGRITDDDIKDALRDSFGHPHAICRSVDESQHEFDRLETVASIIIDATDRRFLLCKGAPDESEYTELHLDELVQGKAPVHA